MRLCSKAADTTASKGKGKETTASNGNGASTSTSATASTSASASSGVAFQRRQPIGKVIHFFVDGDGKQGYDGAKFQEAYSELVLKRVQAMEDERENGEREKSEAEKEKEKLKSDIKDEDLEFFVGDVGADNTGRQRLTLTMHR